MSLQSLNESRTRLDLICNVEARKVCCWLLRRCGDSVLLERVLGRECESMVVLGPILLEVEGAWVG